MVLLDSEDEPKESTPRSSPIKKTDQKKDPIKEKPEEIEIKLEDLDEA